MGICQEDHGYLFVENTSIIYQEDHDYGLDCHGYLPNRPWFGWDKRIMIAGCKCKDHGCLSRGPRTPLRGWGGWEGMIVCIGSHFTAHKTRGTALCVAITCHDVAGFSVVVYSCCRTITFTHSLYDLVQVNHIPCLCLQPSGEPSQETYEDIVSLLPACIRCWYKVKPVVLSQFSHRYAQMAPQGCHSWLEN